MNEGGYKRDSADTLYGKKVLDELRMRKERIDSLRVRLLIVILRERAVREVRRQSGIDENNNELRDYAGVARVLWLCLKKRLLLAVFF